MSIVLHVLAYLALVIFAGAVIMKIRNYMKKPIHVRWELYPVAHEGGGRAAYGGSMLEEVDWWTKPREISRISELKVMVPEILFLKAVWEHNRALWFVSYPFHLGLYILMGFIGLLGISAICQITGYEKAAWFIPLATFTAFIGPLGLLLALSGALGLLWRRIMVMEMRNYSSPSHYFNLVLFIVAAGVSLATWLTVDPDYALARGFVSGLLTFQTIEHDSALFTAQILLVFGLIAYIPLTHMSHFFMKYFLYHDIRWGDEPNVNAPHIDAKIATVLNYPVSWSAAHIAGDGQKTWAQVATTNPTAEPEAGKE